MDQNITKILREKGGSIRKPLYAVGFTRFPTWLRSLVPFLEFKEGGGACSLLELIFLVIIVLICITLLILAVRDKTSYIEVLRLQLFSVFRLEMIMAEKRKPPLHRRSQHPRPKQTGHVTVSCSWPWPLISLYEKNHACQKAWRCGDDAVYTRKISGDTTQQVEIGDQWYIPCCTKCYHSELQPIYVTKAEESPTW